MILRVERLKSGRGIMSIRYVEASLFTAPSGSILLHACNTQGQWSGGIAASFKAQYPEAFEAHKVYCQSRTTEELRGKSQLLACDDNRYIACLFTSERGGRSCDSKPQILSATKGALLHLRELLAEKGLGESSIAACKFNSGIFRVPWEETEAIISELGMPMIIYIPKS